MSLVLVLFGLAMALCLAMAAAWYIAERTGNHGFVDTIWSFATAGTSVAGALIPLGAGTSGPRQMLVAALAALWGGRLGVHVLRRTLEARDDPRYAALRRDWGDQASLQLFWFVQIQALAAFVLVVAVMAAAHRPWSGWRIGDGLGLVLALSAVLGVGLADQQLARFRKDPAHRGRICDRGLWGMTRHPNYFFEWLGWLAYPVIAIDLSLDYLLGFTALGAPVLIYVLLVHVSGIPPTEAHMLRTRGASFRAYQRRVNAFWPGCARRTGDGY